MTRLAPSPLPPGAEDKFCECCFRRWKAQPGRVCRECSGPLQPIPVGIEHAFRIRPQLQFSLLELSIVTALIGVDLGLARASPLGAVIAFFAITPATFRTLAYARRFEEHGLQPRVTKLLQEFVNYLVILYPLYVFAVFLGVLAAGAAAIPLALLATAFVWITGESGIWQVMVLFFGMAIGFGIIAGLGVLFQGISITWPHRPQRTR